MALANYTQLQASVASWLDRTDQTANIPDFIALAEAAINADLRIRDMVRLVTLENNGAGFVDLPPDWLEFIHVKFDGKPMVYIPPDVMRSLTTYGDMTIYSIEGGRMLINQEGAVSGPGATYDSWSDIGETYETLGADARLFDVAYYARVAPLSETPTNPVLTKYPQIYLFKALATAWLFLMDAAKAAQFDGLYRTELASAKNLDLAAKFSGSPLRIRTR